MDKPRRFYLHIGRGKTGTTALQRFFWNNRSRLNKNGFHYPKTGILDIAHHKIAASFCDEDIYWIPAVKHPDKLRAKFSEELQRTNNDVLVSSEAFCRVDPQSLTNILKDFDTYIVFYVRPQDEIVVSQYNQMVKIGNMAQSVSDYMHQITFLDYDALLRPWAEVFGRERILVRLYRSANAKTSILADFLSVLGIENAGSFWYPTEAINLSLSVRGLQFFRLLGDRQFENRTAFIDFVGSHLGRVDGIEPQQYLTPIERQGILDRFRESNKTVARLYLGRDTLFPEPDDHKKAAAQEDLVPAEMAHLVADLWEMRQGNALLTRIKRRIKRLLSDVG